jgi:hypothetical protein
MKRISVAEERAGRNFQTPDSRISSLTITVSAREAWSLVRVLGPIGLQNGDGSFTRLFAAMATCQSHLLRAPNGKSVGVIAALQVLQAAINDHLFACRDVELPGQKTRPARGAGFRPGPLKRGRGEFP